MRSALAAGAPVQELVLSSRSVAFTDTLPRDPERLLDVYVVPDSIFARMSDVEQSQGVLAVLDEAPVSWEAIRDADRIVALDAVQDPGNVGSIIRTAAWFGIDAVLSGPGTADFFNPKVVRASMGGLWAVQLAVVADLPAAVDSLSKSGYLAYGADAGGVPVNAWRPVLPSLVVLGSEAHGISGNVLRSLRGLVAVPGQPGPVEALNVSVAFGAIAHEWVGRHVDTQAPLPGQS